MVEAVFPEDTIQGLSKLVLGLTARQATAISHNGWSELEDLEGFETQNIKDWIKAQARLPVNRGGVTFPTVRDKKFYTLAYWVNNLLRRGKVLVAWEFDAAVLAQSLADYPISDMQREAADTAQKPDLFNYEKWVEWQDDVITFLKGTKNVNKNVSLYYVIRKEPNPIADVDLTQAMRWPIMLLIKEVRMWLTIELSTSISRSSRMVPMLISG